MSKKQYIGIIILAVMILGFAFYWYEARPIITKQNCFKEAKEKVKSAYDEEKATLKEWDERYSIYYKNCLRKEGF